MLKSKMMENTAECPRCHSLAFYEVDKRDEKITCYKCGYQYIGDLDHMIEPLEIFALGVVHLLHTDLSGQTFLINNRITKDKIFKLVKDIPFDPPVKEAYFSYFDKQLKVEFLTQ